MGKFQDLTGQRFGRLVATDAASRTPTKWKCLCDCGKETVVLKTSLTRGLTKSCGCYSTECTVKRNTTHGMVSSQEYKSWVSIRQRCYYDKSPNYENYGGRGIVMSDKFKDNFIAFLDEVGRCPSTGIKYSIDRIDNNLGYVEGNMRWVENKYQSRNKRKTSVNTSGINGVYWNWNMKTGKKLQAVATWYYEIGKKSTKTFSAAKYGIMEAFAMACSYRDNKIAELNKLGFGYTENHGK